MACPQHNLTIHSCHFQGEWYMWIEELKTGKYRAVERYTDPMTGKQKKISVTIERDTRAARKEAQRILDQKIEKAIGDSGRPEALTMEKLTELYLQHQKESVKVSTYTRLQYEMRIISNVLGNDTLIDRLTAPYCLNRIHEAATKPSTINLYIKRTKKLISWAYGADLLENKIWLDKLKPVKDDRKARIEDKYLEPEELQKLLNEFKNPKYRALTHFLALTGCRIGEALALTMDDIDGNYIHITKTYDWSAGALMDTPKTAESIRDIYIQSELVSFLRQYKKDRLQWQLVQGCRSNLLFFTSTGKYLIYSRYQKELSKASAAIGHRISPHALRHTHASILAAQGMSYDAIARRLGHSDSKITREVYMHVTQKLKERDEAIMKDVRIL